MKDSKDDTDVVPEAILYFYPVDPPQIRKQKILDCGEIVGVVQYFQHDLFQSIPRILHFQKTFVVHEHYGRHSAFLCMPQDRCTPEESQIHLKHILSLFNMLYGTWNHVYSTYGKDNKFNEFLMQALTPIVSYVCNQHRSIAHLFSIIDYATLKSGNQRVLLESKHCLDYLKSNYGIQDGLIGYDNKILYTTWDSDTNFYIQLLFQLKKDLPKHHIYIPWESEFKLKNGVSLFRIYIRRSENSPPLTTTTARETTTTTDDPIPTIDTISKTATIPTTQPMNIFDGFSSASEDTLSLRSRFSFDFSPSYNDKRRGILLSTDPSGSSEGSGFDTDTMDDLPRSFTAVTILSTGSSDEDSNKIIKQDSNENPSGWFDESLTDEQKLEQKQSRSSTIDNEIEKTIKIEREDSSNETDDRIHITEIDPYSNDEDIIEYPVSRRTVSNSSSRDRSRTITSSPDIHRTDRNEVRVSWTNIPDKNNEHERDELVLYVQKNSRMMFAGTIEQSLLTDEYLKKLWTLMLSHMANMETDIQGISTVNDILKYSTDVKFQFNENTHQFLEIDKVYDGIRHYRKIPSDESTYMALFARMELDRNPERKVIGLSRGSHLISVDRQKPDRIIYSCRRSQDIS